MQDRYAGDIGDFGKYILLKEIYAVDSSIKLGINWYYVTDNNENSNENRENGDGKHTGYLEDKRYKELFGKLKLFSDLKKIVNEHRSINEIEEKRILPNNTIFYSEPVPNSLSREKWFENSIRKLASADIIFIDPDNGIPTDKVNKTQKKAAKYVFKDEIERYYNLGKSIIIYNHRDRKPSPEYNKKILSSINMGTEIRVLRFKKVSVRDYIFLIQKPHYDLIDQTINHLLNEPYSFLFEPYNLE